MIKIGSFVPLDSKSLKDTCQLALNYNANCFMFYTGSPTNFRRTPLSDYDLSSDISFLKEHGFDKKDIVVHAPYILNLSNPDVEKRQLAINFLTSELERSDAFNASYLVVHPGNYLQLTKEEGIKYISYGINQIINQTSNSKVIICLETMAGKGTEIGSRFEELKDIIDLVDNKQRIGVCFDTCHVYDAGYDIVNHTNKVFEEFDKIIGLDYLKVFHCNDSIYGLDSHKDRHANIGRGTIGFDKMIEIIYNPLFSNIPHILETPYNKDNMPIYKEEIESILAKKDLYK